MLEAAGFVDLECTGELGEEPYREGDRWMVFRASRPVGQQT
jgi:hypothetical protein